LRAARGSAHDEILPDLLEKGVLRRTIRGGAAAARCSWFRLMRRQTW